MTMTLCLKKTYYNQSFFLGDIFPDPIAHREILQLLVKCPLHKTKEGTGKEKGKGTGCDAIVRLADVENHAKQCQFNKR